MKTTRPLSNPPLADLQFLQHLLQKGQAATAETKAQQLLVSYPKSTAVLNLLAMAQQGQHHYQDAATSFRKLLALEPQVAEIHFNLGAVLTQLNDRKAAINCYRKAIQLKPSLAVAQFNLGALLQAQGQWAEAAQHYQQALAAQPNFFAALGNLGTIRQQQGQLAAAAQCYRQALALHQDALGHFNLGTVLYGLGELQQAIQAFRLAVNMEPHFADAWNSLGESLRDRGDLDEAVHCYQQAVAVQGHHDRASYNLGEFLCLSGQLQKAVSHFDASNFADAPERALQCLYKSEQYDDFKHRFDRLTREPRSPSILLGTLSTHYATNFRIANPYPFCDQPMAYVQHTHIDALGAPDSALLQSLLHDIRHLAIAERKQGRLYYGMQSAGNLLQRPEPSFQQLAELLRTKIGAYRQLYADSPTELIRCFPEPIEFSSSWYLRMKQGGYLTSHIHEEGWISGCVYLQVPQRQHTHEGSFEYSTDGDGYPRLHNEFPCETVDQRVGDLVLFPSSLFHRTIPFSANEERVCIAFDVKPTVFWDKRAL